MSEAVRGALLHAPAPSLRRKLAATPGELNPVPPFAAGTIPREMFGVVVGFVTTNGLLALTPVTLPLPCGPVSPLSPLSPFIPGGPVAKSTIEMVVYFGSTSLYRPCSPPDGGASPVIFPDPIALFAVKLTFTQKLSPGMKRLLAPV